MSERNTDWLAASCTSDRTHNLQMCPDWEQNQNDAPTEPQDQGSETFVLYLLQKLSLDKTLSSGRPRDYVHTYRLRAFSAGGEYVTPNVTMPTYSFLSPHLLTGMGQNGPFVGMWANTFPHSFLPTLRHINASATRKDLTGHFTL